MRRKVILGVGATALAAAVGSAAFAPAADAATAGAGTLHTNAAKVVRKGPNHTRHIAIHGSQATIIWFKATRGSTKIIEYTFKVKDTASDGLKAAVCFKRSTHGKITCLVNRKGKGKTVSGSIGFKRPGHVWALAATGKENAAHTGFYPHHEGSFYKVH